MPSLDKKTLERLIEKFGPNIDLRANSDVLLEILKEIRTSPGVGIAADDHYKGDTFTKEYPGDGTYEKNYIRGYAMVPGLTRDQAYLIDEVQAAVDLRLLEALRQGPRASASSKSKKRT
jgi:hypothetical protein